MKHLYKVLVPKSLSWSIIVKDDIKLAVALLRVLPLVFGKVTPTRVKALWHFARFCSKLNRNQGPSGLARYLKACSVVLQQTAGGMEVKSPWELGCNIARTRTGIPCVVSRFHRPLVKAGDRDVIRFWLTLFSLYRVIEFKGTLKLKTITAPGTMLESFLGPWDKHCIDFWDVLPARHRGITSHLSSPWKLECWSLPPILKSSPGSGGQTSVIGLVVDLMAWYVNTELREVLLRWLKVTDSLELSWGLKEIFGLFDRYGEARIRKAWGKPLVLGRLAFLREPGKIRVVAMVDLITQGIMKPIHDKLFCLLRAIEEDGTFDQMKPINRLLDRMRARKLNFSASYDLSAATDRLPVSLQVSLLSVPLGTEIANLWRELLVSRHYALPKESRSWNLGYNSVRYQVGQPMGALSSWAMLAMTHHAIVQYSALRAKVIHLGEWFDLYALLGDDIVIAHETVAAEYLKVMGEIGVEIGLAKSLISRTRSLEFAKRTIIKGHDCSPISLAEIAVALKNVNALGELMRKARAYRDISLTHVARFVGFGYKNLARIQMCFSLDNRLARLAAYLTQPGGLFPVSFECWLAAVGPGYEGTVPPFRVWHLALRVWKTVLESLIRGETKVSRMLPIAYGFRLCEAVTPKGKPVVKHLLQSIFSGGEISQLDGFWDEWIIRPAMDRVRGRFEEVTDKLRVYEPQILPEFSSLEDVWNEVFKLDEELARLPVEMTFVCRDDDMPVPSARVIAWWRILRSKLRKGGSEPVALMLGRAPEVKPRRRRRAS